MKINILLGVIQLTTQFLASYGEQTSIVAAPLDLLVNAGGMATFECEATTDLRTTLMYSWLRDGVHIDEADTRVIVEEGSLTFMNVSTKDTATYTCVAHHGVDNDTASARLHVRAPPGAPYNVVITACYASHANVEWSFDWTKLNFSPLLGFIVEYNTSFTPNEWGVGAKTSSDSRSARIQLSPWATYSFRVKAFNQIGVGDPGTISPSKCRSPQSLPHRHPRNVTTVGDKTNFLVVEWEPMPQIEHNAPDFSYIIEVKEKDRDIMMNFIVHDYTVGRKEIYTGTIYKPHLIKVEAQNQLGPSFIQGESIIGYSGEAAPMVVPTNFELDTEKSVTATSARLRWDPVITNTGLIRGEYRGYKIRHWKRDQMEASLREVLIPDSTEANNKQRLRRTGKKVWADIDNLPPYSHIEADVVVVNTYFSSEGSNILRFSTPEGVPSSVEYVNITYRGSEDIELEWGQPGEPNGIIIGYHVGYRKVEGLDVGDLATSAFVPRRRMYFSGLTPDTAYRVYVWASTQVGRGEEFFIDIRTAEDTSDTIEIHAGPRDLALLQSNEAVFTCEAKAGKLKTVEYKWLRNGVRIDEDDPRVNIEEGSLTIVNITSKDTANYTCVAYRGINNATATAKLEVSAPPGAPFNVVITACHANHANVKWSFARNQEDLSPLLGFIVEYNTSFTPNEWVVCARTSSDSRSARIQLSLWATYSFRVKAFNEIGVGESGDISPSKCRTPQSRPRRHPRNVTTVGDKTNFLVVEWEPMPQIEHNAPDFSYIIEVKEKDRDIMMNFVEYDYTVGRKEIYTGTIYKPYLIKVKAQNQLGPSFIQGEAIIGYSGEAVPTVTPTNFELDSEQEVTDTSARFRWDPVSTSADVIRGEYRGYKIRHWKRNQMEGSLREVFIPDSTEANNKQRLRRTGNKVWVDIDNLPPYSHIEADVVVVNTYFSSEGSNILRFSTPEGVPSAVAYVNITHRGSEDVKLEWGRPKEPNGIIIGYKVAYKKAEGQDLEISAFVPPSVPRINFDGLTPDTAYRVYVWASTRVGRGEEFFIDFRTAEETTELIEIHAGPRDLALLQGSEAVFTCEATAGQLKTVEYKWLRNGVRIGEDDPRVNIEEGSLTIVNITSKDTANYTCVAYRGINNATATAKLEVSAPPGPPYNVVITACYTNHATVKWSFGRNQENLSPLLGFIVEYNTSFTPNEWVVGARTSSDSRSARIQLSPWATYSFRVKAFNEIGAGESGDISPSQCRTPQSRPHRHPRNVTTVGDKTNFLVVEWEPMPQIEHNAPDFSYIIEVEEKDRDIMMNFVEYDYTVGRKEIYTGTIYKPYLIKVKAQNLVGQSIIQAETIIGYSGEDVPDVTPTNFELDSEKELTATNARFRWGPVDTSSGVIRGQYRGYKIRYWKRNQMEASFREVFIPDSTEANSKQRLRRTGNKVWVDIDNLPPYSHIEADVVVVNTYFSSVGSNILRFSTPEGVPSSVEYVNITYRGSEDIELEWGQPGEPNCIIIGYHVGYKKVQDLDVGDLVSSAFVLRRRMCFNGLTPDTTYRVYVWASTQVGRGEEFFIDIRTAEETSDLAIDDVVPTLTTVNVTWLVPDAGRLNEVANYYLEYRKLGQDDWDQVTGEQQNLWQEIKGLDAGTSYQVRVWTTTGKSGSPSCRRLRSGTRTFTTNSEDFILLTQGKKISRVDIASTSTSLVTFTEKNLNIRSPMSLTFNVRKNTVFFSDRRTKSMHMATIEGFKLHSAVRIYQDPRSSIFGIAYDWVHESLYWTDGRRKSIRVMTLTREDRKYITTVVDGMGRPRAIALDIQQRYMYWTDRKKPAMIGRCGMDGTNYSIIINSDITWPDGLTIDYANVACTGRTLN